MSWTMPDSLSREDRRIVDGFLDEQLANLIGFRRQLHAHPELSSQEVETTKAIADQLADRGLLPTVLPRGTGVVCDVSAPETASAGGPTIALRADIDALAMQDESTNDYRSTIDGVAHACGHDAHTTIVLGAGLLLQRLLAQPGAPRGRVRLVFEPAEEALPGGAVDVINDGFLADVDAIYGLHCDPKIDVGTLGLNPGPITSAADLVEIIISGPGGHTARPELTVDVVSVMAQAALKVPERVSQLALPDSVKLVFGSMRTGDAANVVPSHGRLFGTLRTQNHAIWEQAPALVERALADVIEPTGASWQLHHMRGVPPVVNDPLATEFLGQSAADELGEAAILHSEQSWGGDTFAWYLEKIPGSYARLGVHDPSSSELLDLHASTFDIDERAIGYGIRVLAATALRWLRTQETTE